MSKDKHRAAGTPEEAARAALRVVPLIMQTIRGEMRASRSIPISVPQFRALHYVGRHPETSLSDVATHVGVALPTMSRLVDGLVERKLVTRLGHADDRRRMILQLTGPGRALVRAAREMTAATIAARFSALDAGERATIVRAMDLLYRVFTDGTARRVECTVYKGETGDQHV